MKKRLRRKLWKGEFEPPYRRTRKELEANRHVAGLMQALIDEIGLEKFIAHIKERDEAQMSSVKFTTALNKQQKKLVEIVNSCGNGIAGASAVAVAVADIAYISKRYQEGSEAIEVLTNQLGREPGFPIALGQTLDKLNAAARKKDLPAAARANMELDGLLRILLQETYEDTDQEQEAE